MRNPTETAEFFIHIKQPNKAKIVLDLLKPYAENLSELNQLGKLYYEIKDFNNVIKIGQKIENLVNDIQSKINVRNNIINAYIKLNKPEEALKYIELNEEFNKNDYEIQMNKALAFFYLNEKDKGEEILRKILQECKNQEIINKVKFNLGTYELRNGNFQQGLRHFLIDGRKLNIWEEFKYPRNQLWTGENASGKTIIVCAEGGVGDEIISVRFMQHLINIGINPIWLTNRKDVVNLFNRCGFNAISELKELPQDWLWTYSMSIPCYLNLTENDLWKGPYLESLNNTPRLPGKKKIGIKTSGNPYYDQDLHRTIPFNEVIDCIPEDYTIYSFHIEEDIEHPRVISLKNKIKTWDDTLDYVNQMDIIVSSCTSLIHAAGAIGKDSIVIVPILTYYVWAKPEKTSKWYGDNLKILRQIEYDNWNNPLIELRQLLNE